MHRSQHRWKRDAAIVVAILVVIIIVILAVALNQVSWDVGKLIDDSEAVVRANQRHLIVVGLLLPIFTALGTILGRWIGHKRHEQRDNRYIAEIRRLQELVESKDDTISAQGRLIGEYQVHHSG